MEKKELNNYKDRLFLEGRKKGFTDMEVFYTEDSSFSVSIFKQEIYQYKNTSSRGLGFRGLLNDKMTYSYTEDFSESSIEEVLENAIINNEILEISDREKIFSDFQNIKYREVKTYNPVLNDFLPDTKVKIAKEIEEKAYAYSDKVKSVNSSVVASGESYLYISNTAGLELMDRSNYCYAYVYLEVSNGKENKVALSDWIDNDLNKLDIDELVKSCVKKATDQLGSESIKSKDNVAVLFENRCFVDLLSSFIPSFYGENVQKGFSKLSNKLGEKIGNEKINFIDEGATDGLISNTSFDSEGVPTDKKVVVKNGILNTYLHNIKSGLKDNTTSTGNGFKNGYKSSISTSHCNFYLSIGERSLEASISDLDYGLFITELAGLHAGINSISGDFSLQAKGFLVENGKKNVAIDEITVSGNFFKMLFNCVEVCNDLQFDFPSGLGSVGSPSVLFDGLSVGGL